MLVPGASILRRWSAAMRFQITAWSVCGLAVLLTAAEGLAQGSFQNLDFEAAVIPSGTHPGLGVYISSAFPGWSPSTAWYDSVSLGGAAISVIDSSAAPYWYYQPSLQSFIQGQYSAVLFAGGIVNDTSSSISQTGLVPSGTRSLQAKMSWHNAAPVVTLGGQTVNMVPLQMFPGYTLYGGDISSFAGQVETLSITKPPVYGQVPPSWVLLDDIGFSGQVVPEPGVFGLSALAALLIGWRVQRQQP